MRKHFLLFLLLTFFSFLQTEASENAVKIEATNLLSSGSGTSYALRFDDKLLGDHTPGSVDNDNRTREFTMSAWVKTTNQKGHIMGLVQAEHWTPAPSFSVRFNGDKLELFSRTKHNGGFPDGDAIADVTSETLAIDEWAFMTIVVSNANNKISLYKNGILVTEDEFKGNQGAGLLPDESVFFIGNYEFEGAVNEIQLWNKVLSAEEIQSSMEQKNTSDNLIYHYYFDGTEADGIFLNRGTGGECIAEYSKLTLKHQGWFTSVSAAATAPTFVEGRPVPVVTHTVTLPTEIANGTLTVTNGETALVAGENEVEENTSITITATPAPGYILDYLKINDAPFTENTYTVTDNAVITVAFIEESVEVVSKAIHVPARSGNIGYQFRFDDIVLGEHTNGTNNAWENGAVVNKGDNRARNFTMSVWVKPLNTVGELFGHIQAGFYDSEGSFGVGINGNNQLVLKSRAWIDGGTCNGIKELVSDATLNIDEWAFLTVAVDDEARTIKLYKNGVLLATGDLTADKNGNEAHGIGLLQDECVFFAGTSGSSCDVDEIQVWNKTLTTDEIFASMDNFSTVPENLVALYKFDENSIEDIPNQGSGVACNANLVSGKITKYQWYSDYDPSPIQATLVDGHVLPKFAVNYVSETANGSFVIKNGNNIITPGTKVPQYATLTIETTPAEGYQVKSIKVNNTEIEGNTFVLEEEATITVEFTNRLIVKYSISENGSILIKNANTGASFNNGDEFDKNLFIAIGLTPVEGYEVSVFTVNGEDKKEKLKNNVYLITNCQTNLDIKVEFAKKQFNVAFSSNNFGTLTVKKNNVNIESNTQVEYGTELTIIAEPVELATLNAFTINGVDKLNDIKDALQMTITVTEELDIQAEFTIPTWKVTCNITGEGTVKIEDEKGNIHENGASTITEGSEVTLTLTPKTGYELSDLMIDGTSYMQFVTDNKFRFEIDADYTFDVVFIKSTSLQNTSADAISVRYAAGTLHVTGLNAGDRLDIYDIAGNYVRTSEVAETNVSDLADGCYLVKVTAGNTIKTVKFIKK